MEAGLRAGGIPGEEPAAGGQRLRALMEIPWAKLQEGVLQHRWNSPRRPAAPAAVALPRMEGGCWNCRGPHRFSACAVDRQEFYYGCGLPGKTVARCLRCDPYYRRTGRVLGPSDGCRPPPPQRGSSRSGRPYGGGCCRPKRRTTIPKGTHSLNSRRSCRGRPLLRGTKTPD